MKGLICFVWGGLLVALVIAFLVAGSTSAAPGMAPCTVEEDGSGTHLTIQAAVNDAACDPINVGAGTFVENVYVDRSVTIQGQGQGLTAVDGGGSFRVFSIQSGAAVTLREMTIQNGSTFNGGGIHNYQGTLVVSNCTVRDNVATNYGGGIHNEDGELTVTASTVSGNSADSGGGISNWGTLTDTGRLLTLTASAVISNVADNEGGGIYNNGTLTVTDSTLSDNSASNYGGGIYVNAGTATVDHGTLSGNWSDIGGGIYLNFGILTVDFSTMSGNLATTGGAGMSNWYGSVTVTNSTVTGNSSSGGGGGIENGGGTVTVIGSTLSGNSASTIGGGVANYVGTVAISDSSLLGNSSGTGWGGGIASGGTLDISGSTLSGNWSSQSSGGAIGSGGTAMVTSSALSGNSAGQGGGIHNVGALVVTHSTLSGNMSETGGGIFNDAGSLAVVLNTTISDNTSNGAGSGITNRGTMDLASSVVADSPLGQDCEVENGGVLTSLGYNIDSDGTCNLTEPTDQPNTDPLLGPLQDNGGPTWTHALPYASPAVDQGSCPGATADQRGYPRPVDLVGIANADDGCDVGAYELQGPAIYLPIVYKP